MDEVIRDQLNIKTLTPFGGRAGGCISSGGGYHSDTLGDLFIKFNDKENAKLMFDGEFASLEAIHQTQTIRVPKPIKSIAQSGRCCLVSEYIQMQGSVDATLLGTNLAKLHLHNANLLAGEKRAESFVGGNEYSEEAIKQFGFHIPTCCGYLALDNEWCDDWPSFYARNRLKYQVDMLLEKKGDRDLLSLWPMLERKIPLYFKDCESIVPALVHGDLWSGNYAGCKDGPVIFDPASFYAHSEFELGIMKMFGGFSSAVYNAYHEIIPKAKGMEKRVELYELFHNLNHWNHFGSGYKGGTISIMKALS